MENQTISRKQLYALACIFLFAPFVILDEQLNEDEKIFISWYKKFWNFILLYLWVVVGVYLLNSLILKNIFLSKIISFLPIWAVILMIFWIIKIFQSKHIFHETSKITQSSKEIIKNNETIIIDMLIGYNLYVFSKTPDQRYFLKEWVVFSTLMIIFWIFIYFGFPKIFISIIFFFWLFRYISLIANLDFFPQNIKNFINSLFDNNIEQIFAYPKSIFLKFLTFLQHKNISITQLIQFWKMQYSQNWYFYQLQDWKKIYNDFLIVEYMFFLAAILYFWYKYYLFQRYDILFLLFILPLVFLIVRISTCYYFKRLPHIPVFFELTNFLFWLRKILSTKKQKISTNEA